MSDGRRADATATTDAALARIARLDPVLHAFITVTAESAREAARRADARAAGGSPAGLLDGVLFGVKDCIEMAGVRCTMGSSFFADYVPTTDAPTVARLKAAGAVILGKTNLHEFAFGGTSQNAFYGACRNPWDVRRIPGGSSGGSVVAVAAGLVDGALGTDTGSSIRMPAALTGVSGLRPTCGTTSLDGIFPVSGSLDTVGPIARSVALLARIQAAIVDPQAMLDPQALLARLDGDIAGVRIAVPDDFFFAEADPSVAEAVMAAARVLERKGARLVSAVIPGVAEVQEHQAGLLITDAADLHRERLATAPERFSRGVRERIQPGLAMRGVDYARSRRWLEAWRRRVAAFFRDEADVMLTPTAPTTAPLAGDDQNLAEVTRRVSRFAWAWPAAACPALSIPCGFVDGLPVGMQLAGPRGSDGRLLNLGHVFQSVTDWHLTEPPID